MDGTNTFPSMQTIAREAGLKDKRNARKTVRRLEEKGIIIPDGPKIGGRYKATRYRFNLTPTEAISETVTGEVDEFEAIVLMMLEEEDQIIRNIPPGLTEWVSKLRPLPTLIHLSEEQASAAFHAISSLLANGAAHLFGAKRGSSGMILDYEPIWELDEKYGAGTAEALAKLIIQFGVDDDLHPVSVRLFVWRHLADQLIEK